MEFKKGDKVFAKIKGYPPWPAIIKSFVGKKFSVQFYGTGEKGVVKVEDLSYYTKNKEKLHKPLKRKDYNDAIEEIEKAIKRDGGDGEQEEEITAKVPERKSKRKRSSSSLDVESPTKSFKLNSFVDSPKPEEEKEDDSQDKEETTKVNKSKVKDKQEDESQDKEESKKVNKGKLKEKQEDESQDKVETKKNNKSQLNDKQEDESKDKDKPKKVNKSKLEDKPEESKKKDKDEESKKDETIEHKLEEVEKDKMEENDQTNEEIELPKEKTEEIMEISEDKTVQEGDKVEDFSTEQNKGESLKDEEPKTTPSVEPPTTQLSEPAKLPDKEPPRELVSEKHLINLIKYAQHVRIYENLYKSKPCDQTNPSKNLVLPIVVSSDHLLGYRIPPTDFSSFETEFERAIHEETIAKKALEIKSRLENSSTKKKSSDENIIELNTTIEEVNKQFLQDHVERKKTILQNLKNEANLLEIDYNIRNCLGLDEANPKKAADYLVMMLVVQINALMLKKHAHVVETIKRLRHYVGNIKKWQLPESSIVTFKNDAASVRNLAGQVYERFQKILNISDETNNPKVIWEKFLKLVDQFRQDCDHFNDLQVCALCEEPKSRQAFLDSLIELD